MMCFRYTTSTIIMLQLCMKHERGVRVEPWELHLNQLGCTIIKRSPRH